MNVSHHNLHVFLCFGFIYFTSFLTGSEINETRKALNFQSDVVTFIDTYCIDCHASDVRKGETNLEGLKEVGLVYSERNIWEHIHDQLKVGAMPPDDEFQPTDEERATLVSWLHERLNYVDTSKPIDPGRVTVRRMNRTEYDNTIQDLFGIRLTLANTFPGDNVGYGFDNIGDVHTVSPLRMERFLEAAEIVSEFLLKTGKRIELNHNEQTVFFKRQNHKSSDAGVVIDQRGSMEGDYETPLPGEYELRIKAFGLMPISIMEARGVDHTQTWPEHLNALTPEDTDPILPMEVVVNGEVVDRIQVDQVESSIGLKTYKTRFHVPMGVHKVSFRLGNPEGLSQREFAAWKSDQPRLGVKEARLIGPYQVNWEQLHPLHRLIVTTKPGKNLSVDDAARTILLPVAERAYRRPVRPSEIDSLIEFAKGQIESGRSFEEAIQTSLQAILVSPHFLYRFNLGPESLDPEAILPIDDFAIASRLSYFLWGSMPDEALFELAETGMLKQNSVLRNEVARMIDHPRARHFKSEFFRQWLDLRKLQSLAIDGDLFKAFSLDLKKDVETETLLFIESIIDGNGSILDMLRGEYSYMNERTAAVYGISDFKGEDFKRVSLKGMPRKGILTQPSILMLTSYPNRTSPTKRGNWILEAILGDEPPEAPANVPTLEEAQESNPDLTLRDHLELHRTQKTCASCHAVMDPIGLGLENFNAIGQWRVTDGGLPVNASGELPDGNSFDDPLELLNILINREEDFARNFTRKLMTFALGRGLEYYDRIAIDEILEQTKPNGYRIVDIATEIVLSRPFRYQRGDPLYMD